jgi:hypothetical protein
MATSDKTNRTSNKTRTASAESTAQLKRRSLRIPGKIEGIKYGVLYLTRVTKLSGS